MKTLERRIRALEQKQHSNQPGVVIIYPGDPVSEGAQHVIIDDIPRQGYAGTSR